MIDTITTAIDGAGRLVIPKQLRDKVGLHAGVTVNIRVRQGVVEIEPQPADLVLVRKGSLLVARAKGKLPALTNDIVNTTLDAIRNGSDER